jgi:hypothetical protein
MASDGSSQAPQVPPDPTVESTELTRVKRQIRIFKTIFTVIFALIIIVLSGWILLTVYLAVSLSGGVSSILVTALFIGISALVITIVFLRGFRQESTCIISTYIAFQIIVFIVGVIRLIKVLSSPQNKGSPWNFVWSLPLSIIFIIMAHRLLKLIYHRIKLETSSNDGRSMIILVADDTNM